MATFHGSQYGLNASLNFGMTAMANPEPGPSVILGGRGSGKTTALIEWASRSSDRIIVVPYQRELQWINQIAPEVKVVTIEGYLSGNRPHRSGTEYAFDDAQRCLASLLSSSHYLGPVTVDTKDAVSIELKYRIQQELVKSLDSMEDTVGELESWK